MGKKMKVYFMCFLMAAVILMEPVGYVFADDTTSVDSIDRTKTVPRVNSIEVKFTIKQFFDWFGLVDIPEENVFKEFILSHCKLPNVDYSLYDLVCDFEFKTMEEDGSIITSNYSYTIDFEYCEESWSSDHITVEDNLVFNYRKKQDGEDYFFHEFIYKNIVKNADGFQERLISGSKNYYTYNTVISKVDFYFVRESDGKTGQVKRYVFEWDSNFWIQKCVGISFYWYYPESDTQLEAERIENSNGVYDTDPEEESVWSNLLSLIVDAPLILSALFMGFLEISIYIAELFQAVFPFIPPIIFYIFVAVIVITILIAVTKIVLSYF